MQETIHTHVVVAADARDELLRQIEKREIDLLVMGTRGLGGVQKMVLGSTSESMLKMAPCPVMIVKS